MLRTTLALLLLTGAAAGPFADLQIVRQIDQPNVNLCNPCIQFTEQGLNILLNEILNAGVVGGCNKLCSGIKSKGAATACTLVCDVVGIKGFIKAINSTDLDPIYFCETVKACPKANPDAAGSITSVTAAPASGPAGTKFALELNFNIANATSVGEVRIAIKGPVTGGDVSQSFVQMGWQPGNFGAKVNLDTTE